MAFAQEWNLTGRLFDKAEGSLPLEATEIIVSHLDGETISSGFSDNQGKFTFSLPSGKFVVRYRQLGDILKADTIDVHNNVDLGDIMLTVKEHTLNEVMITSQRRLFSQKAGKLVYLVQNSPFASGFNMRDMLHNIPRIDPTSDEIKIIGKNGVVVLVNGHRINLDGKDLDMYLRTLPSENVSKIELVTNPSAEFDAEGNCGVINIILKSKPVGFDGNVHTVLTQRSHFSAEEGFGLSFSSGNFSVEYKINNSNEKRRQIVQNTYSYPDYMRFTTDNTLNRYDILGQNLNSNYQLGDLNLGFFATLNNSRSKAHQLGQMTFNADAYPSNSYSESNHDKYRLETISPYVDWKLDSLGKKITINYNYIHVIDKINQNFDSSTAHSFSNSNNDYSYIVNTLSADLNLPFTWLNFELGGKYVTIQRKGMAGYQASNKA